VRDSPSCDGESVAVSAKPPLGFFQEGCVALFRLLRETQMSVPSPNNFSEPVP